MSTLLTIQNTDLPTNSRAVINDNFSLLNSEKLETSVLSTDTTLAENSDSKVATQKAVKAYVDAGGNVNASETTKGIVEEATAAEIRSLAAAGGTSARLFMNPSTAAPVFGIKSVIAGATITGATLPVPVYQNKTDNEFYACDGNDTAAMKYLGFAISNGTDGNAMTVQFAGIVSGFTGLDEGEKYYLSDTVGTISTTPGTYQVLVGVAISTTELLIQKGRRYANGTITQADAGADETTTTTAITLGFRPTKIVARAFTDTDSSLMVSASGSWVNGVYASVSYASNSTASNVTTSSSYLLNPQRASDGTEDWQVTITSVTDTGFTFSLLQKDITPKTLYFCWEAEGEL